MVKPYIPRYTLWFTRLPWLKQQHLLFNQQLLGGEVPIHKQVDHNYRGHVSQLFATYQCHDYVIVAMNTLRKSRVVMDNYDSCLLIKDFPWILPPLTTRGSAFCLDFRSLTSTSMTFEGLGTWPPSSEKWLQFLRWFAMTCNDHNEIRFLAMQTWVQYNYVKKKWQDNWWCCMSLFRWFSWREASPCPPPLKTYLDLWTIVNTIKKPKSMNMTICTWAFIMRTLPFLVLDMLIVLAYSIPVSRGNLRWHGLWTMEPLPLHLPQIFIRILTNK